MTKLNLPPGFVAIRLDDLAALAANQAKTPSALPAAAGDIWSALSASVALLANHLDDTGATPADLTDGVHAEAVIRVLVLILASALNAATTDKGADLLRALGMLAATERKP